MIPPLPLPHCPVPPPGYAPCTRGYPHDGPCAHPLAGSSTATSSPTTEEQHIRERAAVAADHTDAGEDEDDCRRCNGPVSWEDDIPVYSDRICDLCAYEELDEARADRVVLLGLVEGLRDQTATLEAKRAELQERVDVAEAAADAMVGDAGLAIRTIAAWLTSPHCVEEGCVICARDVEIARGILAGDWLGGVPCDELDRLTAILNPAPPPGAKEEVAVA